MLKPEEYSKIFAEQLPKGVFLTSSDGKQANSMAISWGSVGVMWGIPSVIVMVRETRFTKGILDAGLGFTVSLPLDNTFAKAVAICGTKSGRDMDKYAAAGISTKAPQTGTVPVIAGGPMLHLECDLIFHQLMDKSVVTPDITYDWYGGNPANSHFGTSDHTMYIGRINAAYISEE